MLCPMDVEEKSWIRSDAGVYIGYRTVEDEWNVYSCLDIKICRKEMGSSNASVYWMTGSGVGTMVVSCWRMVLQD